MKPLESTGDRDLLSTYTYPWKKILIGIFITTVCALSAVATTGAPIVFIGEGEKVADLEKFESDRFISRLLGMGDIRGLIDIAPDALDQEEAMRLTERMMSGRFTLNDMYKQMEMM